MSSPLCKSVGKRKKPIRVNSCNSWDPKFKRNFAANLMISAGKRHLAPKLPVMHHLFYTFVFCATILPVILQRECSLRGHFYAIILSDRREGDLRSLECVMWRVRVLKVCPGKLFTIMISKVGGKIWQHTH
jgi:hypothetical protein